MSQTIDERVVKMEFDNANFDSRISASQKALDNFNKFLDKSSSSAAKGCSAFNDFGSALASNVGNITGFGYAVDKISGAFSSFNVAGQMVRTVVDNITNSIISGTSAVVKYATMWENVNVGWEKYNNKTKSVQTIMAATGKSIDEVTSSLEKLNWFTDETSYNYVDMVNNIGKFTAAGVDLDSAVSAMMGIANVAAVSGQGIGEASRAMYNFAQALGTGAVKLQDWKSIENANMATVEFKQNLMDVGVQLGKLYKFEDGMYQTMEGSTDPFNAASFSTSLSDAWLTSDVLIETLKLYSNYAEAVYDVQDAYDTCSEAIAHTSEEGMELGAKAFKAAQEAKTFSEAIESVNDAVSTGWMTTFELIFGNYEEATELWTSLANDLWDIFASGGEERNDVLAEALTPGIDQLHGVLESAGIDVEEFNDRVIEKARESGVQIDYFLDKYGTLDKVIESGMINSSVFQGVLNDLFLEAEHASYGIGENELAFSKFFESVSTNLSGMDSISSDWLTAIKELEASGIRIAGNEELIQQILSGEVKSWEDLSEAQRSSVYLGTDMAVSSFYEFQKAAIEASNSCENMDDALALLNEQGYAAASNMDIFNKILSGQVTNWDDLNKSEKDFFTIGQSTNQIFKDFSSSITEASRGGKDINETWAAMGNTAAITNDQYKLLDGIIQGNIKSWDDLSDAQKEYLISATASNTMSDDIIKSLQQQIIATDGAGLSTKTLTDAYSEFETQLFSLLGGVKEGPAAWQKLDEAGFEYSEGLKLIQDLSDGTISSFDQLSDSEQTLYYQTEALSKIMNREVTSYSDLTAEEKKALFTCDAYTESLRALADSSTEAHDELFGLIDLATKPSGRELLVESFTLLMASLKSLIEETSEAWHDVFPKSTADSIRLMIENINNFIKSMKASDEVMENYKSTVRGIAAAFDIVGQVIKALLIPVKALFGIVGEAGNEALAMTGTIGDMIYNFDKWLKDSNVLVTAMNIVGNTITWLRTEIMHLIRVLIGCEDETSSVFGTIYDKFKDYIGRIVTILDTNDGLNFQAFSEIIKMSLGTIGTAIENFNKRLTDADTGEVAKFVGSALGYLSTIINDVCRIINALVPPATSALHKFLDYIATSLENVNWSNVANNFKILGGAIADFFWRIGDTLFGSHDWKTNFPLIYSLYELATGIIDKVVDVLSKCFNTLKTVLSDFFNWCSEEFSGMTPSDLAVIGFSIALMYMLMAFGSLAWKVAAVLDSVAGIGETIQDFFNQLGKGFANALRGGDWSQKVLRVALGLAAVIMAFSFMASFYDPQSFREIIQSLTILGVVCAALYALVSIVQKGSNAAEKQAKSSLGAIGSLGVFIVSLAASFWLMLNALNTLSNLVKMVDYDILAPFMIDLGILLIGMVGVAVLVSKYEREVKNALGPALLIVAMAYSLSAIIEALNQIKDIPADNLYNGIYGLVLIIGALAMLSMASGAVSLSSVAGLILLVAIVDVMSDSIDRIGSSIDISKLNDVSEKLIYLIFGVLAFTSLLAAFSRGNTKSIIDSTKTVSKSGGAFSNIVESNKSTEQLNGADVGKIGMGIGLIMASIAVMAKGLDMLGSVLGRTDVPWEKVYKTLGAFAVFSIILVGLNGVLPNSGNFADFGIGMIAIAGSMIVMSYALNAIMDVAKQKMAGGVLKKVCAILITMSIVIAILISVSSLTKDAKVGPMIAIVLSIATLLAALGILTALVNTDGDSIVTAANTMCKIMGALAAVFAFSGLTGKANVKPLLAIIGSLAIVYAALFLLAKYTDTDSLDTSIRAIGVTFIGFIGLFAAIGKYGPDADKASKPLAAISVCLAGLSVLALLIGAENLLGVAVGLMVIFGVLAGVLVLISKTGADAEKAGKAILAICSALIPIPIAVGLMALVLAIAPPAELIGGILVLAGVFTILVVAMKAIGKAGENAEKASKSALALSVTLAVIAGAIGILAALISMSGVGGGALLAGVIGMGAVLMALSVSLLIIAQAGDKADSAWKSALKLTAVLGPILLAIAALTAINHFLPASNTAVLLSSLLAIPLVIVALAAALYAFKMTEKPAKEAEKVAPTVINATTNMTVCMIPIGGLLAGMAAIVAAGLLGKSMLAALAIPVVLLALIGVMKIAAKCGDDAEKASKSLLSLSLAMVPIGVVLGALSYFVADPWSLVPISIALGIVLAALVVAFKVLNKGASDITTAAKAALMLSMALLPIAASLGILAKLGAPTSLFPIALALGLILAELVIACDILASKGSDIMNSAKAALVLSLALIPIAGVLALMTLLPDTSKLIPIAISLGVVLLALAVSMRALTSGADFKETAKMALLMIGVLIPVAAVLALLATFTDPMSLIKVAISIGLVLTELIVSLKILSKSDFDYGGLLKSISLMILILAPITAALGILGQIPDTKKLITVAISIGMVLGSLIVALKILATDTSSLGEAAKAAILLSVILVPITAALGILSLVPDIGGLITVAISIGVILLSLTAALKVLANDSSSLGEAAKAAVLLSVALIPISLALGLLGLIPNPTNLIASVISIGVIVAELVIVLKAIAAIGSTADSASKTAITISLALIPIAAALGILSKMSDPLGAISSAVALGLVMLAVCAALKCIANNGSVAGKAASSLATVIGALSVMSACLALLAGTSDPTNVIISAIAIAAIALVIAAILGIIANIGGDTAGAAASLIAMAGVIAIIAGALGGLSALGNFDNITATVISIVIIVVLITAALGIISSMSGAITGAVAIVAVASAISDISSALSGLSGFDGTAIFTSVAAICITMIIACFMCDVAQKHVAGVASLVAIAKAIGEVSSSLGELASADTNSIIVAALAIVGVILAIVILGSIASGASAGIAALTASFAGISVLVATIAGAAVAFSSAALIFTDALAVMQFIDMDAVTENLTKLATAIPKVIAAFATSLALNAPAIAASILILAETIIVTLGEVIPEAINFVWNLILSFFDSMAEYAPQVGEAICQTIQGVLDVMLTYVPTIMATVQQILLQCLTVLVSYAPLFITQLNLLITAILVGLEAIIPVFVDFGMKMIIAFIQGIANNIGELVNAVSDLIVNFLNALTENLPDIIQAGVDLICALIQGISDSLVDIIDAAYKALITFIDGFADAIEENQGDLTDSLIHLFDVAMDALWDFLTKLGGDLWEKGKELLDKLWRGIKWVWTELWSWLGNVWKEFKDYLGGIDLFELGKNILQGLWDGLCELWSSIQGWFEEAWSWVTGSAEEAFDIHSPSRVFKKIGGYLMEGFGIGADNEFENVQKNMEEHWEDIISPISDAARLASEAFSDVNASPTIAPIVDMSNVENAANSLNGMFDDQQLNFNNVNFGGYASLQASRVGYTDPSQNNQNGSNQPNNVTYTFNQNNYSPKPLSRIDIYRQTSNQFSQLAGIGG